LLALTVWSPYVCVALSSPVVNAHGGQARLGEGNKTQAIYTLISEQKYQECKRHMPGAHESATTDSERRRETRWVWRSAHCGVAREHALLLLKLRSL
jgi:hypothetical protein